MQYVRYFIMSKTPILFIVGAGASIPYGYPTGAGLLKEILADDTISSNLKELLEFNEPFSIDAFLAQHCSHDAELTLEAKKLIVKHILLKEDSSKIYQKHANGWYHFLWNMLCNELMDILKLPEGERLKALEERLDIPFRIITFNYDVSLDYYLLSRIWRANMLDEAEKKALLEKMSKAIAHVYGSVRDVPWDNPETAELNEENMAKYGVYDAPLDIDFYAYGSFNYYKDNYNRVEVLEKGYVDSIREKGDVFNLEKGLANWVKLSADNPKPEIIENHIAKVATKKIKVINYERHGDKEIEEKLKPFHEVIANTSSIIFLGFGFDKTNMDLIFKQFKSSAFRYIPIQYTNYEDSGSITRYIEQYFSFEVTYNRIGAFAGFDKPLNIIKSARKTNDAIKQALEHDFDLQ
jgi:hypothetical protein